MRYAAYKTGICYFLLALYLSNLVLAEKAGDRTEVLFTSLSPETILLKVCNSYPIMRCTRALERKYQIIITYEDPPYTHISDLEYNPGHITNIGYVVRESYIEVKYQISPQTGQPIKMKRLLEAIINENTQNDH